MMAEKVVGLGFEIISKLDKLFFDDSIAAFLEKHYYQQLKLRFEHLSNSLPSFLGNQTEAATLSLKMLFFNK